LLCSVKLYHAITDQQEIYAWKEAVFIMNPSRDKVIVRTSIIGILANVLLAVFKAMVGTLSHSVAIVLDAVNNLSDALSSLITIIGIKLAGKAPDKKHPLGHGRIEYLSAAVISMIILYAGISAFVESVKKIIHPETPDYTAISLIIIAVAVVVKIVLGLFVQGQGKKAESDSLIASGKDAMFDSIISASTLVAAAIYLFFGVSLEAWLGAAIALIIIKSGLESLRDTISEILGQRVEPSLSKAIKKDIASFPEVNGAYDLVINNYGPNTLIGAVHIEVPGTMTVEELNDLQYRIMHLIFQKYHVILNGISVYAQNSSSEKINEMREKVYGICDKHPEVINHHGFHVDEESKTIRFDIIVSFDIKDRKEIYHQVVQEVQALYPGYHLEVVLDGDISD